MEEKKVSSQYVVSKCLVAACIVFAAWNVLAIMSSRCLYADGAHEFLRTIEAQNFFSLSWLRQFSYYIPELPLVAAIKLGVIDMKWLRFAFGLGCFLPWLVVLFVCYRLSPQNFWIVILACAAGYLNAAFMAIGEHIFAHAFFWPVLFVILFVRSLSLMPLLVLLISSICLLFSYESQFFLCIPLAVLCLLRIKEEKSAGPKGMNPWPLIVLAIVSGICFAASAIGLYGIIRPLNPAEFGGFRIQSTELIFHKGWTLTWTVLWVCLMLGVWLSEQVWTILCNKIVIFLVGLCLLLWGLWPFLAPEYFDPARQFHHRVLDLLLPIALLPIALISRYRPEWIGASASRLEKLAAVLLIVQSAWQISATCLWQQDIGKLQAILSANRGIIPFHSTFLTRSSLESPQHDFDWSMPCLSIAINPNQNIQSLVCVEWYFGPDRAALWQPFDPLNKENLPDLRHYGLNYSNYIACLPNQAASDLRSPP